MEKVESGGITDTGALGIGSAGTVDADGQGGNFKDWGATGIDTCGMKGTGTDNSGSGGDSGTGR